MGRVTAPLVRAESTAKLYERGLRSFLDWCSSSPAAFSAVASFRHAMRSASLPLRFLLRAAWRSESALLLDGVLSRWIDCCYAHHRSRQNCKDAVAALRAGFAHITLPQANRRLLCWSAEVRVVSRPPIPLQLLTLIAVELIGQGGKQALAGLYSYFLFRTLLRTQEGLCLFPSDFSFSREEPVGEVMVVSLHRVKTGYGQSVRIKDPVLIQILRSLLRACPPKTHVFNFCTRSYRRWFAAAQVVVGLSAPHFVPTSMRAGGAIYLLETGVPLVEVQHLGRWGVLSSMKAYLRTNDLIKEWAALPELVKERCNLVRNMEGQVIASTWSDVMELR
jgi:hypothetical protein